VATASAARPKRSDGRRTVRRILDVAVAMASVEGLEGLTIGRLAARSGVSKSGLYAHFGSKEGLQLAVVRRARSIFTEEVLRPGLAHAPGRAQLVGLCEAFLSYLERGVFPGGCFFASAAAEVGAKPGPLHDRIARHQERWLGLLEQQVAAAVRNGELDGRLDATQAAFEINAVLVAANTAVVLRNDTAALHRARIAIERLVGPFSQATA